MVQNKFGIPQVAQRQLEIFSTAVLLATESPPMSPRKPEWRALMDQLSATSCTAYRAVSTLHCHALRTGPRWLAAAVLACSGKNISVSRGVVLGPRQEVARVFALGDTQLMNVHSTLQVVFENPIFMDYFRSATAEGELGNLNIGSRPARRKTGGGVETLRAIPWIFSWTQTRLVLPAWLGIGEALVEAFEQVSMQ